LIGKKAAAKLIKYLRTQQMERRLKELAKKSRKRQDFTRSLLDKIMKNK
jgi:DNA topoisomerase IA